MEMEEEVEGSGNDVNKLLRSFGKDVVFCFGCFDIGSSVGADVDVDVDVGVCSCTVCISCTACTACISCSCCGVVED